MTETKRRTRRNDEAARARHRVCCEARMSTGPTAGELCPWGALSYFCGSQPGELELHSLCFVHAAAVAMGNATLAEVLAGRRRTEPRLLGGEPLSRALQNLEREFVQVLDAELGGKRG